MKIGGQAVIEGVMMRNKEKVAVAVRLNNGKIKVKRYGSKKMPKFFNWFFMRGIIGLFLMLYDGIKGLLWSADQNLGKEEKISKGEIFLTLFFSLGVGLLFFIGLPFLAASLIELEGFWFNLVDGLLRLGLFFGYILGISYMKDVKKLFRYHGAEHKVINCYESGRKLTVKNIKKFSTLNLRCGTSFIVIVLIISVFLFCLITGRWYVKLLGRIVLVPVIAGVSYEILKLSDRFKENWLVKGMIKPGLWLQKITTKKPSGRQIEVGIRAFKAVVR